MLDVLQELRLATFTGGSPERNAFRRLDTIINDSALKKAMCKVLDKLLFDVIFCVV